MKQTEQEQWRDIAGYEGLYQVSNLGRVWSMERKNRGRTFGGKPVRISIDKRGRCAVCLSKNGISKKLSLPRLVAFHFIENPEPQRKPYVNHLDENTENNRWDNLEWCDHKYNCNYGTRIHRIKTAQSVPVLQYTMDGDFIVEHASMHFAATAINADAGHICDCCLGNRAYAYGYFWRYKDDALYQQAVERLKRKQEAARLSRSAKFTAKALNVVQLSMDGHLIAVFPSTKYAAESVKSHRSTIIDCCNGKVKAVKGFRWMYERDYKSQAR